MPLIIEYFPEEYIALQAELQHHPALIELLQKHPQNETEILLLEIATYCTVIVDGTYGPTDLIRLADILRKRLENMRPDKPVLILN